MASTGGGYTRDGGAGPTVIAKPETHRREYSFLRLDNGIQVVMGSDPKCDKAGAALCVNVGMVHERKDLPGLAHFLEHMLFTGTKKYPDEGEYHKFIQQNGGKANAYTMCFSTNYMFDVKPEMLEQALDRFSRFFHEPLLTRDCTDREINAVDSEFQGGSTSPWWRYVGIMNQSANPDHPFHVACGNNKVLKDEPKERGIDLYDEMIKLYESCYSANGMTLAVIGKESIAELTALVREKFGPVVNKGVTMPIGDQVSPLPSFLPKDWHQLLLQNPVHDIKELCFTWVIPWQDPLWRKKPTAYISHLLGYEGAGSMISALKQQGWISGCSSGDGAWLEGCFSLCKVEFDLTDEGLEKIEEIGMYLFAFISLLQKTPVEKWIFDEMRKLRDIQFKYGEDQQPFNLCSKLTANLQTLPPAEVLSGEILLYDYDAEAISSVLKYLTLDSVRVSHNAKCLADQCTDKDTSYDSPMKFLPIKPEWLAKWGTMVNPGNGSAEATVANAQSMGMHLPNPNPFIPDDLSVRNLPSSPPPLPLKLDGEVPPPVACIYHRQDDAFLQPKAHVEYQIYSPFIQQDVETYARCELWCDCVREALNEYAYDAQVAGVSYALQVSSGILSLTLAGFNDKLGVLLDAIIEKIWSMVDVDENVFKIVLDAYADGIKNQAFKAQPYGQCGARFSELAQRGVGYPAYKIHEVLPKMTRDSLSGFAKKIFARCHVEGLHLGNATAEDALQLGRVLANGLSPNGPMAALTELPERAEATLPDGSTVWTLDSTNDQDPNNAVFMRLQVPDSMENMVHMNLLNKVLSAKFFEILRTQQQLGYVVAMQIAPANNFAYLIAVVQTEFPVDYVRNRIDAFLLEHFKFVAEELGEEEFETCRQGLISEYKVKPKSLGEEFGQFHRYFKNQTYDFGRKQRALAYCESSVSMNSLRQFLKEFVIPAPRIYNQCKKTLDKPDKALPEGSSITEDPAHIKKWTTHHDTVQTFQASAKWSVVGKSKL